MLKRRMSTSKAVVLECWSNGVMSPETRYSKHSICPVRLLFIRRCPQNANRRRLQPFRAALLQRDFLPGITAS